MVRKFFKKGKQQLGFWILFLVRFGQKIRRFTSISFPKLVLFVKYLYSFYMVYFAYLANKRITFTFDFTALNLFSCCSQIYGKMSKLLSNLTYYYNIITISKYRRSADLLVLLKLVSFLAFSWNFL